jgi:hypothetical protein
MTESALTIKPSKDYHSNRLECSAKEKTMIFVSYSHADEKWRQEFEIMSKPMSRDFDLKFWSDKELMGGKWEEQIVDKMGEAIAVLFLVSKNFLASKFIAETEVPYFLKARAERKIEIFWALLGHCDLDCELVKPILTIQSMNGLKPMNEMLEPEWEKAMLNGCQMIRKTLETPLIDANVKKTLPKLTTDFLLLARPSIRDVEVFVYAGGARKWFRQGNIMAGSRKTKINIGADRTPPGTEFRVIALTTESPLTEQEYDNLPAHRTESEMINVKRA